MTTVLDIEHRLDGEIVIRDQYVGDICCKKLTITRTGSVKGNILCKHLQVGGFVEGIAVCHVLEGNSQGTLHGSLYYVTKKDEARVAGLVDYREPPSSVWAVVMPETEEVPALSLADNADIVDAEVFATAVDEFVKTISTEVENDLFDDHTLSLSADVSESPASATGSNMLSVILGQPVEADGATSKFFPTPIEAVEALKKPVPDQLGVSWVSTGRKVPLGARFF